ncbi:MAG: hypothetical protein ABSA46_05055 [Thermodesulfovibrionales bacterium]
MTRRSPHTHKPDHRPTRQYVVREVKTNVRMLPQFGPLEPLPADTVWMTAKRTETYSGRTTVASGDTLSQGECVTTGRRKWGSPHKRLLTALVGWVSAART